MAAMHHLDRRTGLVQLGQRRPFLGGQFSYISQGHDALRKRSFAWADPSSLAAIAIPCNLSMVYISSVSGLI